MLRRRAPVLVLPLLAVLSVGGAQKLTPEQLVRLHLEEGLLGWQPSSDYEREIRGQAVVSQTAMSGRPDAPARGAGSLAGPFRFVSSAASSRLTMQFNTDRYEGESFAVDAQRVAIGFAQPRTGSRSALGIFLSTEPQIVGEGLLGGILNARWPLLDIASRQPRLGYDGFKKLDGRQLHRLRYRARQGQGQVDIHVYFEPETYRHVATVYTRSQAQGMGLTPETSSQQSELHYRLEERFSDFERVGPLTLPKTWTIRYERSGNTTNEWKYELRLEWLEERRK